MKWTKIGRIFCPDNNFEWMHSHAANPIAEKLGDNRFRVYFSCRDGANRSSVAYVDIDITRPQQILNLSERPVVVPGVPGLFDDSGTSMGCLVHHGTLRYLYYLGWNLGVTVPWRNSIGLAISNAQDQEFTKYTKAPILDRSAVDPYSISYPWVMRESEKWKMWYGSNLRWGPARLDMAYVIKYAESEDGIHWRRDGVIALNLKSADESALARPCVLKEGDNYRMWYTYRGRSYRIGYAESIDGVHWNRLDEQAGIDVSPNGWDSESIEYPHVFSHNGEQYMLYNGNGYGRSGFGLAICSNE